MPARASTRSTPSRPQLAGRVPDSTLLSHDLFEGVFARAGLASDVEVVEEFPARYDVAAMRHHRWARGDWQLLPWILGRGPVASDDRKRGAMPAIGRWKMLDNLRRTLSAPAAVLALLVGMDLAVRGRGDLDLSSCSRRSCCRPSFPSSPPSIPRRAGITVRSHLGALGADLRLALAQSALMVTFLAHQAWLMGDAIARTLTRLFVTRRHLLEWVPAAQAAIGPRLDLLGFYRRMAGAVVIGCSGGGRRCVLAGKGLGRWRCRSRRSGSPRRRSRAGRADLLPWRASCQCPMATPRPCG